MADVAKLRELLERCEKASGPDRTLDATLDAVLRVGTPKMDRWVWDNFPEWRASYPGMVEVVHANGDGGVSWSSQPFTASLDASIALVERMLPGATYSIDNITGAEAHIYVDGVESEFESEATTLPLALLSALLAALIFQAEGADV